MKQGKWAEAQGKLEEAVKVAPVYTPSRLRTDIAECLYQQGRYPEALAAMRAAYRIASPGALDDPAALVRYGKYAEAMEEWDEAAEAYQRALYCVRDSDNFTDARPKNPSRLQVKALALTAAGRQIESDDRRAAQDLFRQAIRTDSKCGLAYLDLAFSLGYTDEALYCCEQAVRYLKGRIKETAETRRIEVKGALDAKARQRNRDSRPKP